ncbi:hypothetical protein Tco_0983934, partial [Tanacetum coccineum]
MPCSCDRRGMWDRRENVIIALVNKWLGKRILQPLEIEKDVFSYDSSACLLFEQSIHPCSDESIYIVNSYDDMQELEGSQEDEVGSHLVVSRWHVCKPVLVTFANCEKEYGMWPTCNPDLSFCSGYDDIYGKEDM